MKPTFINHSLITTLSFILLGGGSSGNFSNSYETDNSSSLSAFQLTQISHKNGSVELTWTKSTGVENNLVFNNGGSGIAIFLSDNVTIRNNTAYFNSIDTQKAAHGAQK